ncbi:ABC transporter permease [Halalkalibacillus sediminis]|uniref:ABC transporter permease n=1 Tax=Halalkalibacillus sediminis TaxID=2018042 RepID=A0A2I0QSL0_9BACI|nr:ABC transporter permease [Halalkalibacillus sediminis]PKR77323.1 ABC transporter permease [Halalkalibacillus sediminis]
MIWSIAKNELKKQLKDKSFFFWLLGMPILFIVLFAFMFGEVDNVTYTIHYMDEDETEMSEQFLSAVEGSEVFELEKAESKKEAISLIESGEISTFVFLPEGFEEKLFEGQANEVEFHFDGVKQDNVRPVQNLLENIANGFQEQKINRMITQYVDDEVEQDALLEPPVTIDQTRHESEEMNAITQIVPGYTVMFTFFIIISMVTSFLKDKESGMLARLTSTPLNKYQYLIGKWIPFILIVFVQTWALLGFGYFVYDLYLGDLVAITVLTIALTLTTTGLGLAIALFSKSENFGIMITQILALGGAMLGGLWVPMEIMPDFIQTIGLFVPQYWAQQGFQDIMLRGANFLDIGLSVIILLGVGGIGLLIATRVFKPFLRDAKS